MPRVRLLVDLPDLSDPEVAGDELTQRFAAEVLRAVTNGEGMHVSTAGGQFLVEAQSVQVLDRAEGLILNTISLTDLDQALRNLLDLACEEFADLYAPDQIGVATLRRVLDGVEAVYLIDEQRFATTVEENQVKAALAQALKQNRHWGLRGEL